MMRRKSKLWGGVVAVIIAAGVFYGTVEYMDAQIVPIEAKTPAEVSQVLESQRKRSGCWSAEDFVNMNIMLHEVDNPELFMAVLKGLKYENGKVIYPETVKQPHELVIVKKFLEQANITSMQDLEQCIMFVKNARDYHSSRRVMVAQLFLFG